MSAIIAPPRPGRLDIALVTLLLVLLARPRIPYILTTAEPGSESLVPTLSYYLLIGATAVVGVLRATQGLRVGFVFRDYAAPIVLFLVAAVSIVWSVHPSISARFVVQFGLVLVLGMLLTCYWRLKDVVQVLAVSTFVLLVYSLAWIVLEPSWGLIETYVGTRWRGAFANQNALGRWAGLGLIMASGRLFTRPVSLWPLAGGGLSLALVISTGSAQALGISIGIVVIIAFATIGVKPQRIRGLAELFAFVCAGFLGGLVVLVMRPDLAGMLRLALSGRDGLWEALAPFLEERFVLGYGAGAFWQSSEADIVRRAAQFPASHAHNTYLDVALQLGVPFAIIFALVAVGGLLKSLRLMYLDAELWAYWAAFAFLGIYSLSASMILTGAFEWWFVLVVFVGRFAATGSIVRYGTKFHRAQLSTDLCGMQSALASRIDKKKECTG